jgi:dTMP kinase
VFIVFEGIDGSGKTTLSGKVAAELNKTGVSTHHARPKGKLKSKLAAQIREMARDPRNLTMSPATELFLFIARDTQMIDTVIRPSLGMADVVIADRYLYSPMVLCRARGDLDPKDVDQIVTVAAGGLWPDLVIYCDVDMDTSYTRKTLERIEHPRDPDDFGRKGLRGLGLREAMRKEYLAMAEKDKNRWFMVDNAGGTVEENTLAIANRILKMLGRTPIGEASTEPKPRIEMAPVPRTPDRAADLRKAFYDFLEKLGADGKQRLAAYHLRSMDSDEAWDLRERLLPDAREIVIYGIAPLSSPRAMKLRWSLIEEIPARVARSLGGLWADEDDEAWKMREHLAGSAPYAVALTLGTLDSPRAWKMREKLSKEAAGVVLSSLKRLDTEQAWEMRDTLGAKNKHAWGLLEGLAYLDGDRAWRVRQEHEKKSLPWVILSTLGCESERAWEIRRAYLDKATKLVIRSLAGSTEKEAWEMRGRVGRWANQSLTTIKNIETEEAWNLRRELMDTWPGFAAKSVGLTLAGTERGYGFLWELAARWPNDLNIIHYAVKAYEVHYS